MHPVGEGRKELCFAGVGAVLIHGLVTTTARTHSPPPTKESGIGGPELDFGEQLTGTRALENMGESG